MFSIHRTLSTSLATCLTLPLHHLTLAILVPFAAVPAARGAATADKPSRVVTMVCDDDDGAGGVRRDSSFVDTDFGDGLIELRTREERQGAPPGIQKVRLSWAVAYLREE